jgi:hypothetical protein
MMASDNSQNPRTPDEQGFVWNDALTPMLEASLGRSNESLSPEVWKSYVSVARRAEEVGWSFQEFVIALVEAHLRCCLPKRTLDSISVPKMSETIGRTLCGDPVSKERLLALQEQLLSSPL